MNTVYLVVQQAVYRHKIMGAYTSLDEAKSSIEFYLHVYKKQEGVNWQPDDADGHHCYEICTILVDRPILHETDAQCVAEIARPYKKGEESKYRWVE